MENPSPSKCALKRAEEKLEPSSTRGTESKSSCAKAKSARAKHKNTADDIKECFIETTPDIRYLNAYKAPCVSTIFNLSSVSSHQIILNGAGIDPRRPILRRGVLLVQGRALSLRPGGRVGNRVFGEFV